MSKPRFIRKAGSSTSPAGSGGPTLPGAPNPRVLLTLGLAAGPLFLLTAIVQGFSRQGFEFGRHPISLLSLGDMGWIQIANFVVGGALMLGFAMGLRRVLAGSRGGTWGPVLLAAYGAGLVVAGVFVPDSAWGFPPGAPEGIPVEISRHAALHGVGFLLAFGAISLACVVFARRFMTLRHPKSAAYAATTALASLALILWPGTEGASTRYLVAAVLVWTWTTALGVRVRSQTWPETLTSNLLPGCGRDNGAGATRS